MSAEEIIKALETHVIRGTCYQCPYWENVPHCFPQLLADALELIHQQRGRIEELEAEQTARLMSVEELRGLPVGAVVWMEYRYTDRLDSPGWHYDPVTPMMVSLDPLQGCGDRVLVNQECITELRDDLLDLSQADETGDVCQERYWTRRPTEEQRRGTPWKE